MWKQYLLIRIDREFSPGKLMVHAAHNSVSAVLFAWQKNKLTWETAVRIREWFNSGKCQTKICCKVKDGAELANWVFKTKIFNPNIPTAMIKNGGATEVEPDCIIGAAIGPLSEEEAEELGLADLILF